MQYNCYINYTFMELCAVVNSELTHSRREWLNVSLIKSSEKRELLPVLEPKVGLLNSTEFLLVEGTSFIPVIGSTHLTKNISVSVLSITEFWK